MVSAPKPVVDIDINKFETGIFNVSASIFGETCYVYQLLVLSAKQSKNQLQVSDYVPTLEIEKYLIIIINTTQPPLCFG